MKELSGSVEGLKLWAIGVVLWAAIYGLIALVGWWLRTRGRQEAVVAEAAEPTVAYTSE